jgi:hypothetical protein
VGNEANRGEKEAKKSTEMAKSGWEDLVFCEHRGSIRVDVSGL